MQIFLLAGLVLGIWLILDHLRRRQVLREVIALQKQAIEKGVEAPSLETLLRRIGGGDSSLRLAIIFLCLAGALAAVSFLVPSSIVDSREAILIFRIMGILAGAFGIGNLLIWLVLDRRNR